MTESRYAYVCLDLDAEEVEEASYLLWEAGAEGVEERDAATMTKSSAGVTLVAHFASEALATEVAAELGERWPTRVEFVVGDAWRDSWKEYFKPTRLGDRLVVRPSWEQFEASPTDVVLVVDPGRAFGSGTHETTKLVLREIDRVVVPGMRVLDVGCGSGILGIGALLLGAASVRATDIESDAVDVTLENARFNGVEDRVDVSMIPLEEIDDAFDLVLANIEARVLIPMAPELQKRVAPGGLLILSGLLRDQLEDVRAAYRGLAEEAVTSEGEWIAVLGRASI